MPISAPARRLSLQSLALTPLLTAALLLGTGGTATPTAPTQAAPAPRSVAAPSGPVTLKAAPVSYASVAAVRALRGRLAVKIAYAQRGKPYRYGAAGPSAFDCSGLVYYVFNKRLSVGVPRTANAQRVTTIRIAKSSVQTGDLVFFMSGGRAYHVGIYAGANRVWHSPRPGQRVQLSRIWTSSWVAGRVR